MCFCVSLLLLLFVLFYLVLLGFCYSFVFLFVLGFVGFPVVCSLYVLMYTYIIYIYIYIYTYLFLLCFSMYFSPIQVWGSAFGFPLLPPSSSSLCSSLLFLPWPRRGAQPWAKVGARPLPSFSPYFFPTQAWGSAFGFPLPRRRGPARAPRLGPAYSSDVDRVGFFEAQHILFLCRCLFWFVFVVCSRLVVSFFFAGGLFFVCLGLFLFFVCVVLHCVCLYVCFACFRCFLCFCFVCIIMFLFLF